MFSHCIFQGIQNIFAKLKNFLVPSSSSSKPCKVMRPTVSREISSTNRLQQYRQQSPIYDIFPSSSLSSTINPNPISIPFTYHQDSPIRQSRATYEKISAWLNHTEKLVNPKPSSEDSLFIDSNNEQSHSSLSSIDLNNQGNRKLLRWSNMIFRTVDIDDTWSFSHIFLNGRLCNIDEFVVWLL